MGLAKAYLAKIFKESELLCGLVAIELRISLRLQAKQMSIFPSFHLYQLIVSSHLNQFPLFK